MILMAEKIFYNEPYKKEIISKIVKINDNKVYLDKTIFYPQSGGEPGDKGFIENYRVIDTQKEDNEIANVLEVQPNLKIGQEVKCKIDWVRRHKLMRMHTAAHLLFNVCQMLLNPSVKAAGSNIDEDKSRIDLAYEPMITPEIKQKLEDKCNELINKKLSIKCWWDEVKSDFRWTQIDDLTKLPCGGLHVKKLEEIDTLKIIKRESKGSGKQRLEFQVL
jgi:Ser-tRNA(Ala) deacylase AlaX